MAEEARRPNEYRTFLAYLSSSDPTIGAGDSPYEVVGTDACAPYLDLLDGTAVAQVFIEEIGGEGVSVTLDGGGPEGVIVRSWTEGVLLAAVDLSKSALTVVRFVGACAHEDVHPTYFVTHDAATAAGRYEIESAAVSPELRWAMVTDISEAPQMLWYPTMRTRRSLGTGD